MLPKTFFSTPRRGLLTLALPVLMAVGSSAGAQDAGQAMPPLAPQAQAPQQPEIPAMFEVGPDGMPTTPSTWTDLAALAVNPLVEAEQRAAIEAGIRDWLGGVQQLVIENIDLALDVAQGLIEKVDIEERSGLNYASEVMKTLSAVPNLSSELTSDGVLTNDQGQMNRRIVQDYIRARSQATSEQVMASGTPEEQQRQMQVVMARMTMTSLTDDAHRMFRSVAVRGAPLARQALADAGLDASAYSSELSAVEGASGDDERVAAMIALMDALPTMDLFAFAKALHPKLPPVALPEMADLGAQDATDG